MRRLGQFLILLGGLVLLGPLMVSILAGLVAMFAAFAGLHDLKTTAGAVCGAGALLFFALIWTGIAELVVGLSDILPDSKPGAPPHE
jgi:hypothetical protein